MAPELALEAFETLAPQSTVIDLMCGSGTALKLGVEAGHRAVGFDLDPLAVLISRVSCRRSARYRIVQLAERIVDAAKKAKHPTLPWMDDETEAFTRYWFASQQRDQLQRLAWALAPYRGLTSDALRVALSRTIVTKDAGASLARDVSHSRPHRGRYQQLRRIQGLPCGSDLGRRPG